MKWSKEYYALVTPPIQMREVYWLAGLIEGEGWFTLHTQRYPRVAVKMTDKDVIEKVARLWGTEVSTYSPKRTTNLIKAIIPKTTYSAIVTGCRAIGWMMTLYPLMGSRRRARILEVIAKWKELNYASHVFGRKADCHTDRRHWAFGLCRSCHRRFKREQNKGKNIPDDQFARASVRQTLYRESRIAYATK